SISVEALHDAKSASIYCRTKETRDRRIPQVLGRKRERSKLLLPILRKAWIQKLKPNQLLALAGANTDRALAQLVHEIDVRQFQQPERPRVGRVAAAVFDHPWPLFFHVDNDIIFLRAIRTISGRLLTNQHLAIRIRDIQSAFGLG